MMCRAEKLDMDAKLETLDVDGAPQQFILESEVSIYQLFQYRKDLNIPDKAKLILNIYDNQLYYHKTSHYTPSSMIHQFFKNTEF